MAVVAAAGVVLTYGVAGIDLATAYKGWPAIARVSTEFWLGAAAYELMRPAPARAAYRLLPPLCIGLILVANLLGIPDWWLILCVPALLVGLDKGGSAVFGSRPLVYLGTVSYSAYIMHFPVQLVLMQAYGVLGGRAWGLPLQTLWYLAAMAVAVMVGAAVFHTVEHPARALIRQRMRASPAT
jgi:peptidoglycan/LPS O-acetylase OafA/YrhL